ncbi:MAG: type transport system permease protein [Pseudonocardiales bacterium]|nr:type transport system permease protein [Pseudonocardiales bacterium]
MSIATYARFELLRTFRNRQNFLFSLVFPIIMYFLLAGPTKNNHNFGGDSTHHTGLFAPQYYMVGLLAFGGMIAVLSGGARIAAERTIGWNRQLRLTPLSVRNYMRTKVMISYAMAVISMVLLYSAGITLGVRMPVSHWLQMTLLVLIALIPFTALGIALGHLLKDDAMGPAVGGGVSLFAFLGGTWVPITGGGIFVDFVKLLPSYWLVQAGHIGIGTSNPWNAEAWIVVAAWSLLGVAFAAWAFRRDTGRA